MVFNIELTTVPLVKIAASRGYIMHIYELSMIWWAFPFGVTANTLDS